MSTQQTSIAYLDQQSIQKLFQAFPEWQKKVKFLNSQTFLQAKESLEFFLAPRVRADPYCDEFKIEMETLETHFTESKDEIYDEVLQALDNPENRYISDSLSKKFKKHDLLEYLSK